MRRRRKKADLRIVIRDEELKVRKAAVRPVRPHRDKTSYSRRDGKRLYEEIPGQPGRGFPF